MIKINIQLFGGRGASGAGRNGSGGGSKEKTPLESAKVSFSGLLPTNIKANSEKEAVELFNKANASSKGNGYKITGSRLGLYTIASTFNGKVIPEKFKPRTKAYLYRTSKGTYSFEK